MNDLTDLRHMKRSNRKPPVMPIGHGITQDLCRDLRQLEHAIGAAARERAGPFLRSIRTSALAQDALCQLSTGPNLVEQLSCFDRIMTLPARYAEVDLPIIRCNPDAPTLNLPSLSFEWLILGHIANSSGLADIRVVANDRDVVVALPNPTQDNGGESPHFRRVRDLAAQVLGARTTRSDRPSETVLRFADRMVCDKTRTLRAS